MEGSFQVLGAVGLNVNRRSSPFIFLMGQHHRQALYWSSEWDERASSLFCIHILTFINAMVHYVREHILRHIRLEWRLQNIKCTTTSLLKPKFTIFIALFLIGKRLKLLNSKYNFSSPFYLGETHLRERLGHFWHEPMVWPPECQKQDPLLLLL